MKPLISFLITCLVLPVAAWAAELSMTATSDQTQVVRDNNAFAIELYGQQRGQSGNLFFSPESISTALAMTYGGARADTAAEMARTLHFTLPPGRLNPAMGALLRDRNAVHDGYQLLIEGEVEIYDPCAPTFMSANFSFPVLPAPHRAPSQSW
jgi:serine protease inhibitor